MKLLDLFERLSFAELSNLSIGMEGAGAIRDEDQRKVLAHTNDGLLQLYSRFILKTKYLLIEEQEHITQYHLIEKFTESKNCVEYPYIKDMAADRFTGDLIRILEVYDDCGNQFVLNDTDNCHSLFTPSPQTLQIPNPKTGVPKHILYQARHAIISENLEDTWVEIPFVLEGALQAYIAHKIFSHMNGQDNLIKSQDHYSTYERICQEVEAKDLVSTSVSNSINKLTERGFP